jgi:signal transduction histidine kinase
LQEIEYIADITDNFAIPLQRAMLLEDVRKFADVLQSKIDFATADLREKKAQLEEKYQFEKDMMGIMGHELRTPMTVARGMAELLIQKVSGGLEIAPDYLKEKLDRIFGSITKESDLIQTMLSSSHIDNDKVNFQSTTFDLLELIDFAMFSFRKDAEAKNLKLEFIKPKDKLPEIVSDQNRLQEIVNNLISNAIKYTNEGSIEVTLKQEGDNIRYSVKDTGLGIPANEIQNIGRKFYRIHQHLDEKKDVVRAGGTGLGLYVVKGLLDAMGGKLEIDSTENVGSTFSAIFPIVLKQSDKAMISNKPLDENDMFQKLGLSK